MFEKLIENWLISSDERGYQIPLCEVLLALGYSVLHLSSHGPGEHGKDIIARNRDGRLFAFQLKKGEIKLAEWRRIRAEVEELVRLPVHHPAVRAGESHCPVLITNGAVRGDAVTNIMQWSNRWQQDGSEPLLIWTGGELLRLFIDAHGRYLPTNISTFKDFLELYVSDFKDRLPREKFAQFLERLTDDCTSDRILVAKKRERAIASVVLLASYVIEQYERTGNHISAAEGWTIVAANILRIAERDNLSVRHYSSSLSLVSAALERNLQRFQSELLKRGHLMESRFILAEPYVCKARATLVLGWLAASAFWQGCIQNTSASNAEISDLFRREFKNTGIGGEADWPAYLLIVLYFGASISPSVTEHLLIRWLEILIRENSDRNEKGFPSPYWLQEKVLALRVGELAPFEGEKFAGNSYTTLSAMDMLVRRLRRQAVRQLWPQVSKIKFLEFVPNTSEDWFLWNCEKGGFHIYDSILKASWSAWRSNALRMDRSLVPPTLLLHKEWIAPFILTYPHRLNRLLSALADCIIGRFGDLV